MHKPLAETHAILISGELQTLFRVRADFHVVLNAKTRSLCPFDRGPRRVKPVQSFDIPKAQPITSNATPGAPMVSLVEQKRCARSTSSTKLKSA